MRFIRNIFASALGLFLIGTGRVRKAKEYALSGNVIAAVYFHNPSKKLFTKCVHWLKNKGFIFISENELIDILKNNKPFPKGAVWISFDDGWKDNYINVYPVLESEKIPASFFIVSEAVENSGYYWWTLAEKYKYDLSKNYEEDINKLWQIPEAERKKIIDELSARHGKEMHREAMTVGEIKLMAKHSLVSIGSHTVNHVITINCSGDELQNEFSESKKSLENITGKPVKTFCFPNGDFGEREEVFLKQAGYKAACVCENQFITPQTNLYRITRFSVGEGFFYEELCHIFGVWQRLIVRIKGK